MTPIRDNELGARRAEGPQALVGLSQLALDHMEQGVCVYDADNRIVLVNQRYLSAVQHVGRHRAGRHAAIATCSPTARRSATFLSANSMRSMAGA